MTPAEIAVRLFVLRHRTGDAVCLTSEVWLHERAGTCEPVTWQVWVAAQSEHYEGDTPEAAFEAAEAAGLSARLGDGA